MIDQIESQRQAQNVRQSSELENRESCHCECRNGDDKSDDRHDEHLARKARRGSSFIDKVCVGFDQMMHFLVLVMQNRKCFELRFFACPWRRWWRNPEVRGWYSVDTRYIALMNLPTGFNDRFRNDAANLRKV